MNDYELRYRQEGITGWLLWFTIGVGLSVLINGFHFADDMSYILTNYGSASVSPIFGKVLAYEIMIFSAIILLVVCFVNIIKKNIIFRALYICATVLFIVALLVLRSVNSSTPIPNIMNSIIWITYLFRSKRVKYVFAKTIRITDSGAAV